MGLLVAVAWSAQATDTDPLTYAPSWAGEENSGTFLWDMNHNAMPDVPPGTVPPWPTGGSTKPCLYGPNSWSFEGDACIERQYIGPDPENLFPADPPYMNLHRGPVWPDPPTRGGGLGKYFSDAFWQLDVINGPDTAGVSWVLPNAEEENPLKLIRVQVNWYCPEDSTQQIRFVGASGAEYSVTEVDRGDKVWRGGYEDNWVVTWIDLEILPNPCTEELFVEFYDSVTGDPSYHGYIDAIRFDTVCVPEPGTMMLAGFGVMLLFLVRRKRQRH